MATEFVNEHAHDLDGTYLNGTDATILGIQNHGDGLQVDLAVPCPTCSEAIQLTAEVTTATDAELGVPLEDAVDIYD